jgi:hypothetical protein
MRGDRKVDLDCCDPELLNSEMALPLRHCRLALRSGVNVCRASLDTESCVLTPAKLNLSWSN